MTDIITNVEARTVVVTHSDAVTKEEMLAKLQKVRSFLTRSFFVGRYNLERIPHSPIEYYYPTNIHAHSGRKQVGSQWLWRHKVGLHCHSLSRCAELNRSLIESNP